MLDLCQHNMFARNSVESKCPILTCRLGACPFELQSLTLQRDFSAATYPGFQGRDLIPLDRSS